VISKDYKEFEVHKVVMQILSASWVRASELAHVLYINIASSLQLTENKIYSYLFLLYIRKDNKGYQLKEVDTAKKGGTWYLRKSTVALTSSFPCNLNSLISQAIYTPSNQIPLMHVEDSQNAALLSRIPDILEINSSIQPTCTNLTTNDETIQYDNVSNTTNFTNDNAELQSNTIDDTTVFNLKTAEFYTVEEARLDEFYKKLHKKMKVTPNKHNRRTPK